MLRSWGAVFLFAILASCATAPITYVTIKNQNISLNELTFIVHQMMPLGVRLVSPNGREFLSQNFIYENNQYTAANDSHTRYYAHITILNSSRPYDLQIEVRKEDRVDRKGQIRYVYRGPDFRLAKILKAQLRDRLAKRRDDLNVIDDFRVF